MKKYFFLAAAAAMMLSACSDNDLGDFVNEGPIPLTIGTSFDEGPVVTTRGNDVGYQTDALDNTNNQLGLFILKKDGTGVTSPTKENYEQFNLGSNSLAAGAGTTNALPAKYSQVSTSTTLYYPDTKGQELDIYAYAPYISAVAATPTPTASYIPNTFNDISTQKITFLTKKNQTAEADYRASDVLWGCAGTGTTIAASVASGGAYALLGKTGNNNTISAATYLATKKNDGTSSLTSSQLTGAYWFTYDDTAPVNEENKADVFVPLLHRGSKVVINLITDNSMPYTKLQHAKVSLGVDYVEGELNIQTGAFTGSGTNAADYIVLTDNLGAGTNAGPYPATGTQTGYTCCAVIVPHVATKAKAAGKQIMIDLGDGTTWTNGTYAWNPSSDITFESGKVYTYTITVKASELTVVANVADWVSAGATITGDATLQ